MLATEAKEIVVITRSGEYEGRIGHALPRQSGWETITVKFGCVHVQFYPEDFRPLRVGKDRVAL